MKQYEKTWRDDAATFQHALQRVSQIILPQTTGVVPGELHFYVQRGMSYVTARTYLADVWCGVEEVFPVIVPPKDRARHNEAWYLVLSRLRKKLKTLQRSDSGWEGRWVVDMQTPRPGSGYLHQLTIAWHVHAKARHWQKVPSAEELLYRSTGARDMTTLMVMVRDKWREVIGQLSVELEKIERREEQIDTAAAVLACASQAARAQAIESTRFFEQLAGLREAYQAQHAAAFREYLNRVDESQVLPPSSEALVLRLSLDKRPDATGPDYHSVRSELSALWPTTADEEVEGE